MMMRNGFLAAFKTCTSASRLQSSFRRIIELKSEENSVAIKGWVSSLRKMKENLFVDVVDGSSGQPLQVVISKSQAPPNLHYGCSVEVVGDLITNKNEQIEMTNCDVKVLGDCNLEEGYPFAPKKTYSIDYIRQFLHLRQKYSGFNALFRIRSEATWAVNAYFKEKGFINVHAPVLTSNDCEGAGEVFIADKPSPMQYAKTPSKPVRFFDEEAYLTVSGQMHLEVAARGLSDVYSFGPTFRAENSKSRLHLSEFYMLEAETTRLSSLEELTQSVEEMIHYVTHCLIKNSIQDIERCRQVLGLPSMVESTKSIEEVLMSPFSTMSYDEASDVISKNTDKLKTQFNPGEGFTKEQELFLVKHNNNVPLFVVEWPKKTKPFYMKTMDSDENKVMAFDLLFPNVGEVAGGSFREDNYDKLQAVLKKNKVIDKLDWYLELRKFGNVTTCGYGLGFERYLLVMLQMLNIKDVIPFPRWPHNCAL